MSGQSSKMSFPELSVPCVMQIRSFLKTCKVANYCRKMKQLVEKVEENRSFIEKQRKAVSFKVHTYALEVALFSSYGW